MIQNQRYFAAAPEIDLSVVIAVYNEEKIVPELLSRLSQTLGSTDLDYEIVIVDDGSSDGTRAVLLEHLTTCPNLRVVTLYRNAGQVAAISAGMSVARGGWILMMDGDLQHNPADIPMFLAARSDGSDMVASYRLKREESVRRKLITKVFNLINRTLTGVNISDFGSSYRLIRFEIIAMMKDRSGYVHYNTPNLFMNARKFIEIPITQWQRKSGASKWTFLMFVLFNFDFLMSTMRPILLAVCGALGGMAIGIVLYFFHLIGAISSVQALTGPVSIFLTSVVIFMLAVIWREVVRMRALILGVPPFLISAVHAAPPDRSTAGTVPTA